MCYRLRIGIKIHIFLYLPCLVPDVRVIKKCFAIATKSRARGKPQTTWMTNIQRDMRVLGFHEQDIRDRGKWPRMIGKADPA